MINYFNLPESAIFEKALPKNRLFSEKSNENLYAALRTIEKFSLFANIKDATFKTQYIDEIDKDYFNEIVFIELSINDPTYLNQILNGIFRKIKYQTIVCIHYSNHVCFCACVGRPQKLRVDEIKIEHFHLSNMLPLESQEIWENFNVFYLWNGTYRGLYQNLVKIFDRYSKDNNIVTQTFVAQLYMYIAGFEDAGLGKQIETSNLIARKIKKHLCISPGFNIQWGYKYEDVWDFLQWKDPSIPGYDFISMLRDYHEFEPDFMLELPPNILKQISELEDQEQAEMDIIETDPNFSPEKFIKEEMDDLIYNRNRDNW